MPIRTETTTGTPPARQDWADVLRGLAIVLVALGHVLGGLIAADYIRGDKAAAQRLYDWIYAFHMPAFLWASGLFAAPSLRKYGPAGFVGRKAATLLYPYFLWGIITWGFHGLMRGSTNKPFDPSEPLRMLYDPHAGYWFLYILFALMVLFALCWNRWTTRILLTGGLLLIYAFQEVVRFAANLPFAFDARSWQYMPAVGIMLCQFGLYFIIGPWSAPAAKRVAGSAPLGILLTVPPLAFGGMTILLFHPFEPADPYRFSMAASGTLGLAALSVIIDRACWGRWLTVLGRHSLEIYIVSGLVAVPTRLLLHRAGTDDLAVHAAVGTPMAILGPLALVGIAARLRFRYLFAWPYPALPKSPS